MVLHDYTDNFRPNLDWNQFSEATRLEGLKLYRKMFLPLDGYWYQAVKERFGNEAAMECDLWVWKNFMRYELKHITTIFKIDGHNVEAFFKATQLMAWSGNMRVNFELRNCNNGVMRVTQCPALEALLREGRGGERDYCRLVEQRKMDFQTAFFNPRMKATPMRVPPETLGSGICCEWNVVC